MLDDEQLRKRMDRKYATLNECQPGIGELFRLLPPPMMGQPVAVDMTIGEYWPRRSMLCQALVVVTVLVGVYWMVRFLIPSSRLSLSLAISTYWPTNLGLRLTLCIQLLAIGLGAAAFMRLAAVRRAEGNSSAFTLNWRVLRQATFEQALHHERIWREGSEQWSWRTRAKVCGLYTVVQPNVLLLPVGLIVINALMCVGFMMMYGLCSGVVGRVWALRLMAEFRYAYYLAALGVGASVGLAYVIKVVM